MQTLFQNDKNQRPLDLAIQAINQLRLMLPGASLRDAKKQNNTFNLAAGTFGRYSTSTDDTVLSGNTSYMDGLTAGHRLIVSGMHFTGSVLVLASGKVLFQNCIFDTPVTVDAGGKATFTNCGFKENVVNAGAVANVGICNGWRLGAAHVNTTITFELP
ncbi:hypothetical protein UFOVP777_11 [uncultured Caudovirales phage]|uniref:Uncharacterized protein n=1 Tax=uncultured Caudovirales phage TaxID=2100421 RepID=A0A6J5NY13_9CAUD|nr:hypothetical protein UFOVP777_11 [uncultured Caudovirales phage]